MSTIKNLEINYDKISEEKMRLLQLRGLATGEIQGPPTGYPDVDMPWLAKYDIESILSETPQQTIYQFLYDNNKNRPDNVAIKYFGEKITYKELFEKIDLCAKALITQGIKKGDVVGLATPTTPESIYILYAANKIGAVVNVIDLRKTNEEIKHEIIEGNTKMLIVFDGQVKRIGNAATEVGVEHIIALSPTISLPTYKTALASPRQFIKNVIEKNNKNREYIFYEELIENTDLTIEVIENEFNPKEAAFLAHTSGTTALSKTVALSDGTVNNIVRQYMANGMERNEKDEYLSVIPIFLAFGISLGVHMSMSMGMETTIIPSYDIKDTESYFRKNQIEHTAFPPSGYIELIESKKFNRDRLSETITLGSGADGISENEEIRIIVELMNFLTHGYGGTEVGSAFSTEIVGKAAGKLLKELRELYKDEMSRNRKMTKDELRLKLLEISEKAIALSPGSSGIPLPGNNVMIIDHETGEKLRYNQIGDIVMIVDYPMIKYLNNQELTEETRIDLGNGKVGIKLNDAGFVNEKGFLFVKGRFQDAIHENDTIIWPVDIENECYINENVRQCAVVKDNCDRINIYVTQRRNTNKDEIEKEISEIISTKYPSINFEVKVIETMPLTSNGKVDRKSLKNKVYELKK